MGFNLDFPVCMPFIYKALTTYSLSGGKTVPGTREKKSAADGFGAERVGRGRESEGGNQAKEGGEF